jgi:hypothetical protein
MPIYMRAVSVQNGGEGKAKGRQRKPTLVNICAVNKGNAAATADRITVLTAKADAANILHAPQGSALMIKSFTKTHRYVSTR